MPALAQLLSEARACKQCAGDLPLGPNPIVRAHTEARIMLIGQAPGTRVHETGIPWNDPSGEKLRDWLGVGREQFYDERVFAIMPMGFCYPGKGSSGDLPPRRECAPLWHTKLWSLMPKLQMTLLIGSYAVRNYLPQQSHLSVSELVRQSDPRGGNFVPLVHPSPRNKLWLKKNPWFEINIVPVLRDRLRNILRE